MAQTKKDIQAALAAAGINPLKRYGQHFLIDGNLLRKLVAAAGVTRMDAVLEVGPGTGTLTEELLAAAGHVVAVEIDKGLAGICRGRFGDLARFTLLHRDVLERKSQIAPEVVGELGRRRDELARSGTGEVVARDGGLGEDAGFPEGGQAAHPPRAEGLPARAMLVANLPYQVATPLLIELLMGEMRVSPLCFTVQREVADRLAAPPGGKEYGPISIFAQALARMERIANVPPGAFWPAPAVDSAMVRMDVRADASLAPTVKRGLARLVHGCFNHRRKTMRYNLRELLAADEYEQLEATGRWNFNDRPERIRVEEWVELAKTLAK